MADTTDDGYDEATNRNDGRGTIPSGVDESEVEESEVDDSTEDNAFDDSHSADEIASKLEPPAERPGDINSRDNEAEWSREP